MDRRASKSCSFVHRLCVKKLDVTELAISQLIDLQADHLHSATRLEEINEVLLTGFDGDVADPKRMPIRRLDTLRSVASTAGRLRLQFGIVSYLIHVSVVYLDFHTHEFLILLLHCFVDHSSVFKLDMCEISSNMPVTTSHLNNVAAVFEEVLQLLLIWLFVNPAHPNSLATLRLLWPVRFPPTSWL